MELSMIQYDAQGLVPAIAQDAVSGQVLMLAYMNEASLLRTLEEGYAVYWSRSRQQFWKKGETSGHLQKVVSVDYDCDGDAILLRVEQTGPACHTGERSCFHHRLQGKEGSASAGVLSELTEVIRDRQQHPKEGSYTNYLLDKGLSKIAKKVGEEAVEVVIAAVEHNQEELIYESADLLYHLLVLFAQQNVSLAQVWKELENRR